MPTAPAPHPEALILGGGLAGSALAILLARAGRPVTLVEQHALPHHKVCGEFLSHEALLYLANLGLDPTTLGALPITHLRLASGPTLSRARLPFPALSLTRSTLDEALLTLATQAGAGILRGTRIESLRLTNSTGRDPLWQASLAGDQILSSPHLFLATGKHDLRGHPRPPGRQNSLIAFKQYFHLLPEQAADLASHVELHLFPGGYAGLQLVEPDAPTPDQPPTRVPHLPSPGHGFPNTPNDTPDRRTPTATPESTSTQPPTRVPHLPPPGHGFPATSTATPIASTPITIPEPPSTQPQTRVPHVPLSGRGFPQTQNVTQSAAPSSPQTPPNRANLCLLVDRETYRRLGATWPALLAHIERHAPYLARRLADSTPLLEKPLALSNIPYGHLRLYPNPDEPSLWRLGDQTAVIPSFSGDGMSIALHTAHLAAHLFLSGLTPAHLAADLHRTLHRQIALATTLSQTLVSPRAQPLIRLAARLFPGLLPRLATATRIPSQALLSPASSVPLR